MRLLWYLRGKDESVEHFFHRDALYARNASTDLFYVSRGVAPREAHESLFAPDAVAWRAGALEVRERGKSRSWLRRVENASLLLSFSWDPEGLRLADSAALLAASPLRRAFVGGVHYWRREQDEETEARDLAAYSAMAAVARPLLYVATPPLEHSKVAGSAASQERRNAWARARLPPLGGAVLPYDLMDASAGERFGTVDGLHHGCSYPELWGWSLTNRSVRSAGGDCHDWHAASLVMMLAGALGGEAGGQATG